MIARAVGPHPAAPQGMPLRGAPIVFSRHILPYGLRKFARFATAVWGIPAADKTDEQLANEGVNALLGWMKEIGVATEISSLGVTEDMLEGITDATFIMNGGFKVFTREDVLSVLRESL